MMYASFQQNSSKRNILNNAAYSIFRSSESSNAGGGSGGGKSSNNRGNSSSSRRVNYSVRESSNGSSSFLQRSISADNVVVRQRGFKPSDRHDPAKRTFLEGLTSKILHFDMDSGNSTPINLQKLLTPASDSTEMLHTKSKKMYASSYFYAPTHPTVEDQVELARRISSSLSDVKNVKSKGQSMYVNRKKRSVKWIHDGNGAEDEDEPSSPVHRDKVPLKCMMNPSGKVMDIHGIQALGEESNIHQVPPNPEKLFDIVRDLNNQRGRGAEIFAKRRKRSEKWVVDTEQPQSPSSYGYGLAPTYPMKQDTGVNENTKFDNKPFYNPFTVDISMDYSNPPATSCGHQRQRQCSRASFSSAHSDCGACHTEVKKIYLREVAVGTDPESKPEARLHEKPRRGSFANGYHHHQQRSCQPSSNGYGGRAGRGKPAQSTVGSYVHQSSRSNGHHSGHYNGHHSHHAQKNGYQKGMSTYQNGNGYQNGGGYQNGCQNGGGCHAANAYQNGNGCRNGSNYQNGHAYQKGNGYQNGNGYPQEQFNEDTEENPEEDYTPVPVKQLIQEFEKTCRPVMQYKQYCPKLVAPMNGNQGDLSRYFESRREVVYHQRRVPAEQQQQQQQQQQLQRGQYRGNGYVSSGDDEEDDEDDDDDDVSLDDSLSPVDFYRIDNRRLLAQSNISGNRSSSMSTLDEYYRRQLQQYQAIEFAEDGKKFMDSEAEVPPAARAAALAAVASQDEILTQKKHLRNTPVLENLVAGTTTPECFKKEFTEEVAAKLYDGKYQGPKITSYQNLKNYNTAPRGWDQSQPIYRPIKFEKPQDNKLVYSDF